MTVGIAVANVTYLPSPEIAGQFPPHGDPVTSTLTAVVTPSWRSRTYTRSMGSRYMPSMRLVLRATNVTKRPLPEIAGWTEQMSPMTPAGQTLAICGVPVGG